MFYDNFLKLCELKNVSPKKAVMDIGLSNSTSTKWKKTASVPKGETLAKLAEYFGVTTDYLINGDGSHSLSTISGFTPEECEIINKYRALDRHGKRIIDFALNEEYARIAEAASESVAEIIAFPTKVIPLLGGSFAAGSPEPDFGNSWTEHEVAADSRAEFAIHVNGNSMEPWLSDGSIAYGVKRDPAEGEVGAFMLDGEYLVKQFCTDPMGNVYLFSLNRQRSDCDVFIPRDSEHDLQCFGRIIMNERLPVPRV